MTRRLNCLRRLQPQKRTPPEGGQRGSKLGRTQEEFLSCRLYHRAPMRGTNIGASGLTDALLDTINLRVWDAEAPVGQPLSRGLLCRAKGAPGALSSQTPMPVSNPKECRKVKGGGCR